MKNLILQWIFLFLSILTAIVSTDVLFTLPSSAGFNLSFLVHAPIMAPIFILFICLTLFFLYRSTHKLDGIEIFYLGVFGALLSFIGIISFAFNIPHRIEWLIFLGLIFLFISCLWSFYNSRGKNNA